MPIIGMQYQIVEWDGSIDVVTVVAVSALGDMVIRYPDGLTQRVALAYFKQALAPLAVN